MTKTNDGASKEGAALTPDYAEMAGRLRTIGKDLLRQGEAEGSHDLIEKAKRVLSMADQIRPENGAP